MHTKVFTLTEHTVETTKPGCTVYDTTKGIHLHIHVLQSTKPTREWQTNVTVTLTVTATPTLYRYMYTCMYMYMYTHIYTHYVIYTYISIYALYYRTQPAPYMY